MSAYWGASPTKFRDTKKERKKEKRIRKKITVQQEIQ